MSLYIALPGPRGHEQFVFWLVSGMLTAGLAAHHVAALAQDGGLGLQEGVAGEAGQGGVLGGGQT